MTERVSGFRLAWKVARNCVDDRGRILRLCSHHFRPDVTSENKSDLGTFKIDLRPIARHAFHRGTSWKTWGWQMDFNTCEMGIAFKCLNEKEFRSKAIK